MKKKLAISSAGCITAPITSETTAGVGGATIIVVPTANATTASLVTAFTSHGAAAWCIIWPFHLTSNVGFIFGDASNDATEETRARPCVFFCGVSLRQKERREDWRG